MPRITNIQPPTAQKLNGRWQLSITYTAKFSSFEVATFNFRDAIQVWESDGWFSDDDRLTPWRNNVTFNPDSREVVRTKTTTVSSDDLNTELGAEEVYLKIRLFNSDLDTTPIIKNSPTINLAP
jgi:hypothetical protein